MTRKPPVAAACAATALLGSVLLARTLTVDDDGPADYRSIQAALDAAAPGDLVAVAPGLYREVIVLRSGVAVIGAGADATTLDGGQKGSVVTAIGCDGSTLLEGFTITRGLAPIGGGVIVRGGEPRLRRNVVLANQAAALSGYGYSAGGGVALIDSLALVSENTIASNQADYGGGVEIDGGAPRVERNLISGNGAGAGGGLDAYLSADGARVFGNRVTSNTAVYGAGIEIAGLGAAVVTNNLIDGNTATGGGLGAYGGGIDVYDASPSIANNTIALNRASYGGGVSVLDEFGTTVLANNVVLGNRATRRGGGFDLEAPGAQVEANLFFGNQPGDCGGASAALCAGAGSLFADPLLSDPGQGDFRLREGSPGIDSAAPARAPDDDARGQRRPLDGDRDGVAAPDRGAFEFDRNEVLGVAMTAASGFSWEAVEGATAYHVYSGALSTLARLGVDVCRDADDPDPTDLYFPDTLAPPRGDGLAYLVTAVVAGVEGSPGFDGSGLERAPAGSCP